MPFRLLNISASVKIIGVWATGISTSITSTIQKHEPSVKEIIISLFSMNTTKPINKYWLNIFVQCVTNFFMAKDRIIAKDRMIET